MRRPANASILSRSIPIIWNGRCRFLEVDGIGEVNARPDVMAGESAHAAGWTQGTPIDLLAG